jgi:hypothetical protein
MERFLPHVDMIMHNAKGQSCKIIWQESRLAMKLATLHYIFGRKEFWILEKKEKAFI